MANRHLEAISPLADLATPGRYGTQMASPPGVVMRERAGISIFHVVAGKGRAADAAAALGLLIGNQVVDSPAFVGGSRQQIVGIAPGHWLWLAEGTGPATAEAMLREAVSGSATLSDLSSAKVMIRISGPEARAVMVKGCPVDLDPMVFAPGSAATALVDQFVCQFWQVDEAPTYDLLVSRSLAGSFWSWLTSSAAEFGYEVVSPRQG